MNEDNINPSAPAKRHSRIDTDKLKKLANTDKIKSTVGHVMEHLDEEGFNMGNASAAAAY